MGLENLMLCGIFFEPGADIPLYGKLPEPQKPLTIRDFPASGFQLHIHGSGGYIDNAGLKKYGDEKQCFKLTNYEAAIADAFADDSTIKKLLVRLGKAKE